jgi:hypothetical protein
MTEELTEKLNVMIKRRLKTNQDCRRYLANLINRLEAGEVDPTIAGRAGYLTNILIRCIEGTEIEERLAKLEQLSGKGGLRAVGGGR